MNMGSDISGIFKNLRRYNGVMRFEYWGRDVLCLPLTYFFMLLKKKKIKKILLSNKSAAWIKRVEGEEKKKISGIVNDLEAWV